MSRMIDSQYMTQDERLNAWFAQLREKAPSRNPPGRKVAFITTPRCGSKYFCYSLAGTGKFGFPAEWMNQTYIEAYLRVCQPADLSVNEYLRFILDKTTSSNGIFALNFHVDQYVHWKNQGVDLLALGFDRIYRLYRQDRLAQALSYAKASRSGQWRATDQPKASVPTSQITFPMIIESMHKLAMMDVFYDSNLAGLVHKSYAYEDFTASPSCFKDVLKDCGVEHQDDADFACGLKIQRGEDDSVLLSQLRKYLGCSSADI